MKSRLEVIPLAKTRRFTILKPSVRMRRDKLANIYGHISKYFLGTKVRVRLALKQLTPMTPAVILPDN